MHDNDDIPKVNKFNYLNSLLEGTAGKTIQGLTLSEANYDAAIRIFSCLRNVVGILNKL